MNKLKNIKFRQILYPGIIVLVIIGMVISVFLTIKFLTGSINAAFVINESAIQSELIRVDLEAYKKTAKKLDIPFPYPPTLSPEE